jgi:Tfp pilus assembly protein PilF
MNISIRAVIVSRRMQPGGPVGVLLLAFLLGAGPVERGEAALGRGDVRAALQAFEEAVRADGKSARARYLRGVAHARARNLAAAESDYRGAIALDAKLAEPHNNLGALLVEQGKADEGLRLLGRATAIDPSYKEAHFNIGLAHDALKQFREAAEAYRRARDLDPKDVDVRVNLGAALRRTGEVDGALAEFREAVKLAPRDAQARYNLGAVLSDRGDLDAAATEVTEATRLDARYALAFRRLGSIELRRSRCAAARAAFKRFFELAPKVPRTETDETLAKCKAK